MKRLCLLIAVCFLFLALLFSCSLKGPETLIHDENTENKEGEVIRGLDQDEDEEEQEKQADLEDLEEQSAEFLSGKFVSETEIEFEFSFPVKVLSLSFEPPLETESVDDGSRVKVFLEESPKPGMLFSASIEAEDEWENTIVVETVLLARNNRVPKLQINELRTEYSRPRVEFIEFKMLSEGNLGGLRVFVASNSANPLLYQFKPVEVSAGEYVVLHLRTLDEKLSVSEYGDCLAESGGTDSSPTARDIWIPGSVKLLRKTDAVYVMDQDDNVLDAVMISETPNAAWSRDFLAEAARFLFDKGAWSSPSGEICRPVDAVDTSGIVTAATKSISRDEAAENVGNATNWYVTAGGGVTPGLPNKL
jgi:hypothetical protein